MNVPQFSVIEEHAAIQEELTEAFDRVMASGQFIMANEAAQFESEFASWIGSRYAVVCNSGTDALQLALSALDIGPGDDVIVPGFTFVATATAPIWVGARPILADVGWDGNLTARSVEDVWTPSTKAVIAVHLYGQPAPMDSLFELCSDRGAWLIEDAAQGVGATYHGRKVGTLGAMACFSFFPTKNLGALGDAGAVVTDDPFLNDRLRLLRQHGAREKYVHQALGRNSRMDEFQAAFLRVKLKHLDQRQAERATIAARYDEVLAGTDVSSIRPLVRRANSISSYHQYPVLTRRDRDRDRAEMQRLGVDASVHYPLTVGQQMFWKRRYGAPTCLPNAERLAKDVLCLPIWPGMSTAQVQHVCDVVGGDLSPDLTRSVESLD